MNDDFENCQVSIWGCEEAEHKGRTGRIVMKVDHFYLVCIGDETLTLGAPNIYFPNHPKGYNQECFN